MTGHGQIGAVKPSIKLSLVVGRWVEAPPVPTPEQHGQALKFSLQSTGASVSVHIIRRNSEGRTTAWVAVHRGPLRRKDVEADVADLIPIDGFTASPGDVLVLRIKALEDAARVSVRGLQLRAKEVPAPARTPGAIGPEGLHWPRFSGGGSLEHSVLVFGTFDVQNYGDLLFPIVAESRLRRAGLSVIAVSPTDTTAPFEDAPRPISIEEVASRNPPGRGVLIGGGNIIHPRPTSLPDYQRADLDHFAYPALWIGATTLAATYDLPIAWNAPGVPSAASWWPARDVSWAAAAAADYLSVRDQESHDNLQAIGQSVAIVPDTAVEISRVWPLSGLEPIARDALESRGFAADARYIAVHAKKRSLQGPVEELARELDALSVHTGRTTALVAIGACHGDDIIARRLSELMITPTAVFDHASSLRQLAAIIAFADLHVCSSLHAYITSFSYGRPGILIAPPRNAKFQAFTRMVGRTEDLVWDWTTALAAARDRLSHEPVRLDLISEDISRQLDDHWAAIVAGLSDPQAGRSRRGDFLRTITAINLRRTGWAATLSGLVAKE